MYCDNCPFMRYQPPLETEQDIDNSLTSHRIRVSEHRHNRAYDPSEPGMRTWVEPFTRRSWAATWVITVVAGLLLRRFVFDRGIATPFIIVATITLGVLLGVGRLLSKRLVRN